MAEIPPPPPGKGWFRVECSDAGYGGPGWMRVTSQGNDYRSDEGGSYSHHRITDEDRSRAMRKALASRDGKRFVITPGQARHILNGPRHPVRKDSTVTSYTKSIWAFLSALLGAITTAVMAAPTHTFGGVDTLGWLGVATTVLITTGGVYGLTNQPTSPPPPPPPAPPPAVLDPQPGYQPDPHLADQQAKAERLAHPITDAHSRSNRRRLASGLPAWNFQLARPVPPVIPPR